LEGLADFFLDESDNNRYYLGIGQELVRGYHFRIQQNARLGLPGVISPPTRSSMGMLPPQGHFSARAPVTDQEFHQQHHTQSNAQEVYEQHHVQNASIFGPQAPTPAVTLESDFQPHYRRSLMASSEQNRQG
jgi:hypothetical protein